MVVHHIWLLGIGIDFGRVQFEYCDLGSILQLGILKIQEAINDDSLHINIVNFPGTATEQGMTFVGPIGRYCDNCKDIHRSNPGWPPPSSNSKGTGRQHSSPTPRPQETQRDPTHRTSRDAALVTTPQELWAKLAEVPNTDSAKVVLFDLARHSEITRRQKTSGIEQMVQDLMNIFGKLSSKST